MLYVYCVDTEHAQSLHQLITVTQRARTILPYQTWDGNDFILLRAWERHNGTGKDLNVLYNILNETPFCRKVYQHVHISNL